MRFKKWILSKSLCYLGFPDSENLCIEKTIQKLSLYFTKVITFITLKILHVYNRFNLMLKFHVTGVEEDIWV